MKYDEWFDKYKPQVNHFERAKQDESVADDDICGFNGRMYETFGEEKQYSFELSKTTKKVWTIIEDGEGNEYVITGYHYINRLGYFVTEVEYEEEMEVLIDF